MVYSVPHVIYIQTKNSKESKDPRFSRSQEDKRRTKRHPPPPCSRTQETSSLTMLPSSKRLSTPLFKKVMEEGKIFHSPLFLARLLKVEGVNRFSVAVPKKIAKTAVERNKIRRRFYSALRPLDPKISPSVQGVFIVKAPVIKSSLAEISSELKSFFVKIGLMK